MSQSHHLLNEGIIKQAAFLSTDFLTEDCKAHISEPSSLCSHRLVEKDTKWKTKSHSRPAVEFTNNRFHNVSDPLPHAEMGQGRIPVRRRSAGDSKGVITAPRLQTVTLSWIFYQGARLRSNRVQESKKPDKQVKYQM